jgi:hypothetical protein
MHFLLTPPPNLAYFSVSHTRDEPFGSDTMDGTYDIFKDSPTGPIWIECVVGLDRATERLKLLNYATPGEYFAYDVRQPGIIVRFSVGAAVSDACYLFKRDENGDRIGIETILCLTEVRKRLLSAIKPGSYLIYDPTKGKFVEPFSKSA